jgi:hypothetical protein
MGAFSEEIEGSWTPFERSAKASMELELADPLAMRVSCIWKPRASLTTLAWHFCRFRFKFSCSLLYNQKTGNTMYTHSKGCLNVL